ncbi:2-dehydropantoate 2-reductase [Paraglaciecola mesophila]|uniref:2-dehydropantoate 2-reductase n=1 Tax=Paraglaciecola mesophila TaxID=197222 RepID=A0A857JGI6_9ALTE|nr:2-dehydropantoate 2-reductase [Paraglaciecola mesophila]QHJ11103.1 2-dehydropantoate 2-reductase [Paraglaciecola mesophila]
MKVAIVGNGAIGNLLVLKCIKVHQEVGVVLRQQRNFTLNATDIAGQSHQIDINSIALASLCDFDMLILPVKAYQIVDALRQVKPYIGPTQTIVLLHNGMGVIEDAKMLLPNNPLIAATTSHAAYKPDNHRLIETGLGSCQLGYVLNPPNNALHIKRENEQKSEVKADVLQTVTCDQVLDTLLAPCSWQQNIEQALWDKLAINAVINPLTAVNKIKNGQLLEATYQIMIKDICAETAAVMNALSFVGSKEQLYQKVLDVAQATSENYSSMYQDIAHNRPSEIDYINGYICREAEKLAIDVPLNTALVSQIKALA